jgi:hypothetical protein
LEDSRLLGGFVATDGDPGVLSIHKRTFETSQKLDVNVSFSEVVKGLRKTGPLMKWPVSDFLHFMKNARERIAKGSFTFDAHSPVLSQQNS